MRYLVSKGSLRRVRTPEGAKFFGQPIGTIITPGMAFKARGEHGSAALQDQFDFEDNAPEVPYVNGHQSVAREYVQARGHYGAEGMEERARRQKELRDMRRRAMGS